MRLQAAFIAALVLAVGAAAPAQAETERLSGTEFNRAMRCVTYTELPALRSVAPDGSTLAARVVAERSGRDYQLVRRAEVQSARIIQQGARAATPEAAERLRQRMVTTCAGLLDTDPVQLTSR